MSMLREAYCPKDVVPAASLSKIMTKYIDSDQTSKLGMLPKIISFLKSFLAMCRYGAYNCSCIVMMTMTDDNQRFNAIID